MKLCSVTWSVDTPGTADPKEGYLYSEVAEQAAWVEMSQDLDDDLPDPPRDNKDPPPRRLPAFPDSVRVTPELDRLVSRLRHEEVFRSSFTWGGPWLFWHKSGAPVLALFYSCPEEEGWHVDAHVLLDGVPLVRPGDVPGFQRFPGSLLSGDAFAAFLAALSPEQLALATELWQEHWP